MADTNSFEFNNTQTGAGSQNIQGYNASGNLSNQAAGPVTFDGFMEALRKGCSDGAGPMYEKVNEDVLEPLEEIAQMEEPTTEKGAMSLKKRIASYVEKLQPYAPFIRKTLAAFAEGALSTMPPPASWVAGGCMEVIRDARRD